MVELHLYLGDRHLFAELGADSYDETRRSLHVEAERISTIHGPAVFAIAYGVTCVNVG